MGEEVDLNEGGESAGASSQSRRSPLSAHAIIERMILADLDSGEFTRRTQAQIIKLAREHRVSDEEVERIVEQWREKSALSDSEGPRLYDFAEGSVVGKLILLALLMAVVNVVWALLT